MNVQTSFFLFCFRVRKIQYHIVINAQIVEHGDKDASTFVNSSLISYPLKVKVTFITCIVFIEILLSESMNWAVDFKMLTGSNGLQAKWNQNPASK